MSAPVTELNLHAKLLAFRPAMVTAAQFIYDEWQQDENGYDQEFAWGGICSAISSEFAMVLSDISTMEGGQDGDDHSYLFVYDDHDAFEVDLPYHLYERGGGYNWTKLPGVQFSIEDIVIVRVNRTDILEDQE